MKLVPSNNPGPEGRKFAIAAAVSAVIALFIGPAAILAIAFGVRAVLLLKRANSPKLLMLLAVASALVGIWVVAF